MFSVYTPLEIIQICISSNMQLSKKRKIEAIEECVAQVQNGTYSYSKAATECGVSKSSMWRYVKNVVEPFGPRGPHKSIDDDDVDQLAHNISKAQSMSVSENLATLKMDMVSLASAKGIKFKNNVPSYGTVYGTLKRLKEVGIHFSRPNKTQIARLNALQTSHVQPFFAQVENARKHYPVLDVESRRWIALDETPLHARASSDSGKVLMNRSIKCNAALRSAALNDGDGHMTMTLAAGADGHIYKR